MLYLLIGGRERTQKQRGNFIRLCLQVKEIVMMATKIAEYFYACAWNKTDCTMSMGSTLMEFFYTSKILSLAVEMYVNKIQSVGLPILNNSSKATLGAYIVKNLKYWQVFLL